MSLEKLENTLPSQASAADLNLLSLAGSGDNAPALPKISELQNKPASPGDEVAATATPATPTTIIPVVFFSITFDCVSKFCHK